MPRGASTSLSGGALPLRDGIVLGMAKFNRVIEVDYVEQVARHASEGPQWQEP